jgi:DNA-binding response OmpR family regulator
MSSIVIIEEDDLMRGLLTEWLTAAGYTVFGQAPRAAPPGNGADLMIIGLDRPRQAGVDVVRSVQRRARSACVS